MSTGTYLSGGVHLALILFLLFGGIFSRANRAEVAVTEVTMISEAEFAALTRPDEAPDVIEEPRQPVIALPDDAAPDTPDTDAPPVATAPPEREEPEAPDTVPEPPELTIPNAEVTTEAPVIAPPTFDDGDTVAPDATPAPAPRVAPDPVPLENPLAETAPEVVPDTVPVPSPEAETVTEPETAAAPEAATTEIVTEAETPVETAPSRSIRPRTRPERPVAQAEAPQTDPVRDALAEALESAPAAARPTPSGPPLTFGETEAFRVAVGRCWSVDVGSRSANVTVTVGVTMNRDGTVANGAVRRISAEGGDAEAQQAAYEKARRAILRCQAGGFPLPPEKYDQWNEIEMTFNPEGMRVR